MDLVSIRHDPLVLLRFTAVEVAELEQAAAHHYDAACRSMTEHGGVVRGLVNRAYADLEPSTYLNSGALNLLMKVVENSVTEVGAGLRADLRKIWDANFVVLNNPLEVRLAPR